MTTLIAQFESHADGLIAWVTRSKTDPEAYEITLRGDGDGFVEMIVAPTLRDAIQQARALILN